MNDLLQPTSRRTLLQRGVAVVAGALGLRLAANEPSGDTAPASCVRPAGGNTLRFYARRFRVHAHGQTPGQLPVASGRCDSHCDLLAEPDGKAVGRYFATSFHPDSATASARGATGVLALQTLQIAEGSLFGIGPGPTGAGTETAHAIFGGTGRFAGAHGSYCIRESREAPGEGRIEFVVNLLT